MNNTNRIIIAFIALVVIAGGVFAHQSNEGNNFKQMGNLFHGVDFHDKMESILENGTYSDLVKFRKDVGFDVMPFVNSQSDFNSQKDRHKNIESEGHRGGYGDCMMDDENDGNNWNSHNNFGYGHAYGRGMMG